MIQKLIIVPVALWLLICGLAGRAFTPTQAQASPAQPSLIGLAEAGFLSFLGASDPKRGWLPEDQCKTLGRREMRFVVCDLRGRLSDVTVGKLEKGDGGMGGWVSAITPKLPDAAIGLALSGVANPTPRRARSQSLQNTVYQKTIASLLRSKGLSVSKPRLTQHLRVDLNGDKVDEVVLCAHSNDTLGTVPGAKAGDYAVAALRFLSRGTVKTVPLTISIHRKNVEFDASERFDVIAVADINGDGKMEIALHRRYYEGESLDIITFDGNNVRHVLSGSWGA